MNVIMVLKNLKPLFCLNSVLNMTIEVMCDSPELISLTLNV